MVMGPALGLGAAAAWGAGDFCGGLATRRARLFPVSLVSQATGLVILFAAALALGETFPDARTLALSAGAGLAGAVGLTALYAALATGRMGVAAPVTAVLSAALPAAFAALSLGAPSAAKLAGFALALGGIWLLARPDAVGVAHTRGLGLALLSGAGFGFLLILLGAAGEGGTWWPLAVARAASSSAILTAALVTGRAGLPGARSAWALALASGTLEAVGNACYVLAAQVARLDVAAVLASLYPATTVLLARVVLRETLTRTQMGGVAVTLVAVVLIAGSW